MESGGLVQQKRSCDRTTTSAVEGGYGRTPTAVDMGPKANGIARASAPPQILRMDSLARSLAYVVAQRTESADRLDDHANILSTQGGDWYFGRSCGRVVRPSKCPVALGPQLARTPLPKSPAHQLAGVGSDLTSEATADDVGRLAAWLIRERYIESVARLIDPAWRAMSERELTLHVSSRFTEAELKEKFLAKSAERTAIKARFRGYNIVMALVVGLIWARENVAEGDWTAAVAKVGAAGLGAWALNKLLYARDIAPTSIMARRSGNFGRWFQGVARSNWKVSSLVRGLGWIELGSLLSSSGGDPSVPRWPDVIYDVDLDKEEASWPRPSESFRRAGINQWYRIKGTNFYLAKVEGDLLGTVSDILVPPAY